MLTSTFDFPSEAKSMCHNNNINIHCEALLIGFMLAVNAHYTAHVCCLKVFTVPAALSLMRST